MDFLLEDKTVLVSGSYRGTGLTIAQQFAQLGAKVIVHAHTSDQLTDVDLTPFAGTVIGDLGTAAGIETVIEQFKHDYSTLDVLVNNYGIAMGGNLDSLSYDDWHTLYDHNLVSVAQLSQHLLPLIKASSQGRIINLGTIGSTRPNARMPHYYAAKGALANLTVSLAKTLKGTGITVNLVSPGLIRTAEVEARFTETARKRGWGETFEEAEPKLTEAYFDNPMERFATREDVAAVVIFLASAQAGFINAQNIRVDGGALDIV